MASKRPIRSGTLDNVPGLDDDFRSMYASLKRMESTTSVISDISEEEIPADNKNEESKIDASVDLAERLNGVDLNDADAIWSKLSESERQQIGQVMQQKNTINMSAVLPCFNPWWEKKVQTIQISEVDGDHTDVIDVYEHEWRDLQHPKIKKTIANFSDISKEPPTKDIDNNLTNVLAAYCSTVRFFYGEHLRSAYDAVKYLLVICTTLKPNSIENFTNPKLAIEAVRKEARREGLTIEDEDFIQMKKDIESLTEGPDPNHQSNCYILAALSDLYRLFQLAKAKSRSSSSSSSSLAARKRIDSSNQTLEISTGPEQAKELRQFVSRFGDYKIVEFVSPDRRTITSTLKKVEYFLAYAKQFLSYS